MATYPPSSASQLAAYLPALYQDNPVVGRFLLAFEAILLSGVERSDGPHRDLEPFATGQGLEDKIGCLATLFDPQTTPPDFLPWLATWTAFTLRSDLSLGSQRAFLSTIIPRYQWRGTRRNLADMLSVFTLGSPDIEEAPEGGFQVGVQATVGVDTYVGENPPHYFSVTIHLPPDLTDEERGRQIEITRAVIDLEKPAHTFYDLILLGIPTLQIGVRSTVGVDTLLGDAPA